ncbi:hypothetical protein llap_12771 [Limosa lapponica baueri]|uniref:Uncharacterized protein n=1 Tax=Limosa lapponica baueri TaxID=1758121 RepID=A0A2I0TT24_LIMLA|nr:hypothetical protein llap_12771 [Limosa lapponica baueri]
MGRHEDPEVLRRRTSFQDDLKRQRENKPRGRKKKKRREQQAEKRKGRKEKKKKKKKKKKKSHKWCEEQHPRTLRGRQHRKEGAGWDFVVKPGPSIN